MCADYDDYRRPIDLVKGFDYSTFLPVYEVAPAIGRYYVTPPTLTDKQFAAALMDSNARLIVKAILESGGATIDADVTDRADRELGLIYGSKGQPLQQKDSSYELKTYDSVIETLLAGGLPAVLDSGSLKIKEQSPITGYATAANQVLIQGYIDGIEALLAGGLPAALDSGSLKIKEQSPLTSITAKGSEGLSVKQKATTGELLPIITNLPYDIPSGATDRSGSVSATIANNAHSFLIDEVGDSGKKYYLAMIAGAQNVSSSAKFQLRAGTGGAAGEVPTAVKFDVICYGQSPCYNFIPPLLFATGDGTTRVKLLISNWTGAETQVQMPAIVFTIT